MDGPYDRGTKPSVESPYGEIQVNSRPGRRLLLVAGVLSGCVAALHVGVMLYGADAYRYFGAGERMARMAERGSSGPAIITTALVLLFGAWAAYAFSGAGAIARLPWLRVCLPIIGLVYTARGLVVVPQLLLWLSAGSAGVPLRHLAFSAVSLMVGATYVAGTYLAWRSMPLAQAGR